MKAFLRLLTVWAGILASGCATRDVEESQTLLPGQNVLPPMAVRTALTQTVNFSAHVKPILRAKCVACHDASAQPGGLKLESRTAAVKSGALGGFIVPGHPERSAFVTNIKGAHAGVKAMPPVGERLTADEIAILQRWIKQGANWPAAE